MRAIKHGRYNTSKLLIMNGADVDAVDDEGLTPFLIAAQEGDVKLLTLLKAEWDGTDSAQRERDGPWESDPG